MNDIEIGTPIATIRYTKHHDPIAKLDVAFAAIKNEGIRFRKNTPKTGKLLQELEASDNAAWTHAYPSRRRCDDTGKLIEWTYTIYTSTPETAAQISEILKSETTFRSIHHPEENDIELFLDFDIHGWSLEYLMSRLEDGYQL